MNLSKSNHYRPIGVPASQLYDLLRILGIIMPATVSVQATTCALKIDQVFLACLLDAAKVITQICKRVNMVALAVGKVGKH